MEKFKFGSSSKLIKLASYLGLKNKEVASADLPCGYTCPMAAMCKSFANPVTGKITDGRQSKIRCYGTSLEAAFTSLRLKNWHNFNLVRGLNSTDKIASVILDSIPDHLKVIRIHSFGDFFSQNYFDAWVKVAQERQDIIFFGYTKVLPYMRIAKPDNFSLVYSFGGLMDYDLKSEPAAYIVESVEQAQALGVAVSCVNHPADDFDFIRSQKSFALLLHGTQPKERQELEYAKIRVA